MGKRKDGNQEGDVVLIHYEDKPMAYARIEAIEPDVKKDWHHVTLLLLTIPLRTVTWILREAYVDGEPFTMGGQPVKLEKVERQKTGVRSQESGGLPASGGQESGGLPASGGQESGDVGVPQAGRVRETGDTGKEMHRPENRQLPGQTVKVVPFKREK
jgi:hypothetical protein